MTLDVLRGMPIMPLWSCVVILSSLLIVVSEKATM